jgi:hypothetical protein
MTSKHKGMRGYADGMYKKHKESFWVKDENLHRAGLPAHILYSTSMKKDIHIYMYRGLKHNLKGPWWDNCEGTLGVIVYAILGVHTQSKEQFLDKSWRRAALLQAFMD